MPKEPVGSPQDNDDGAAAAAKAAAAAADDKGADDKGADDKGADNKDKGADDKGGEKVFAGKFKTPEDLEAGYTGLSETIGKQSSELGSLRQQVEQLTQTNAELQKTDEGAPTLQAQLEEVLEKVEAGDITQSEGMILTSKLSTEYATENAVQSMQTLNSERQLGESRDAFAKENPNFFELRDSGALDPYKSGLPGLHDDFSAYYAHQASEAAANTETLVAKALEEGKELGRQEMTNISEGDVRTEKVLQKPGPGAEKIARKDAGTYTKTELTNSGLEALKAARAKT